MNQRSIPVDAKVEQWLAKLTTGMHEALKRKFQQYYQEFMSSTSKKLPDKDKMSKIIHDSIGQILITCAQIEWTSQMTTALLQMTDNAASQPLKRVKNNYKRKTELYVECVEKPGLTMRDR